MCPWLSAYHDKHNDLYDVTEEKTGSSALQASNGHLTLAQLEHVSSFLDFVSWRRRCRLGQRHAKRVAGFEYIFMVLHQFMCFVV